MTAEQVRVFLVSRGAPVGQLRPDDALFSTGHVDSFLLVDLLLFLEQHSGRKIDPATLSLPDIDTLGRLAILGSRSESR